MVLKGYDISELNLKEIDAVYDDIQDLIVGNISEGRFKLKKISRNVEYDSYGGDPFLHHIKIIDVLIHSSELNKTFHAHVSGEIKDEYETLTDTYEEIKVYEGLVYPQ